MEQMDLEQLRADAVRMLYLKRLTYHDLAKELGCSYGMVKQFMARNRDTAYVAEGIKDWLSKQ